jgi:hypothetical protein
VPLKITVTRNFKENLDGRESLFEWILAKYFNLHWPKYSISGFEQMMFKMNSPAIEMNLVMEPYKMLRK